MTGIGFHRKKNIASLFTNKVRNASYKTSLVLKNVHVGNFKVLLSIYFIVVSLENN